MPDELPGGQLCHAGFSRRIHAWAMANLNRRYEGLVADRKRELFGNLRGKVVEIGPGTGPNLRYYREGVQWIGVEPNPFMHPYLRRQAQALGMNVDLRHGLAQRLAMEDNSADAVVSTLVLCSLEDVESALREVLRVLRPGGVFLFLEHVAAPQGSRLRRLQRMLRPIWSKLADGCRPERETWRPIERAGFKSTNIEHFRVPVPVVGPHIIGTATSSVS